MREDTGPFHAATGAGAVEPLARPPINGIGRALARRHIRLSESTLIWAGLAIILVLAGLLRLTALNWDNGHGLHPDERYIVGTANDLQIPSSIGAFFDTNSSTLNPYNQNAESFVYGTVPIFLGRIGANLSGPLGFGNRSTYDDIYEVGRTLSALADIGTVVLAFLIASRLFGSRAGLLAALLYAFSALAIQHSHFFVADPFATFFGAGALYYSIRIVQDGRWRDYALAGALLGLATASKLTMVSLVPVVGLAALVRAIPSIEALLRDSTPSTPVDSSRSLGRAWMGILLALVVAFMVFRVGQPYAFQSPSWSNFAVWQDDFNCKDNNCGFITETAGRVFNLNPQFVKVQIDQQNLLNGGSWPPNVQWIGRTHWIWPLQQMIIWGMGPAFGIAGWLGFFYLAWRAFRKREWVLLVPVAWVAGYFLFMGGQFALYIRYFLPLYPALAVFAAALLLDMWNWASNASQAEPFDRRPQLGPGFAIGSRPAGRAESRMSLVSFADVTKAALPVLVRTVAVAVPVLTILWGLAYFHIYSKPVTRVEASSWIYAHVPPGSMIANEDWDDSMPISLPGIGDGNSYQHLSFSNFEFDTKDKVDQLVKYLDQADFIILSSDRLDKTITRVPVNYPITARYYEELFKGNLGFELAKQFESNPEVLGVQIPDSGAEEAWTVYDHPRVEVFRKTTAYSHERTVAVLGANAFEETLALVPKDAAHNGLFLSTNDLQKQQAGGTFSSIFNPDSIPNRIPLWTWLFVVELISFSVLPFALMLFRSLPDRGYLLAKPLGFLILGWLVWLAASVRVLDFTRVTIALVLVLMLLAGAAAGWATRANVRSFFRDHWRAILLWEALFLGAFLAFYIIRLNNPDLWHPARGGEKPMDFAYFNAVIRSTTMPPYDPWFAGGYLNYYYFGQMLTATITKFTGIMPEVAFNLAVPLYFSLAVVATYSLVYNLAEATRRFMRRRPGGGRISVRGPVLAGLGAVLLVLCVGNLGGADQLVRNLSSVSPWHLSNPWYHQNGGGFPVIQDRRGFPFLGGLIASLGGIKAMIFDGKHLNLPVDWYWAPSRMMPPTGSITEFPYFTYLFADLHAHLMSIPFAITSLAVGAAVVLNATRLLREDATYRRWASWGLIAVLALVIGALRWINSWDYPSFLLMGLFAVLIAERVSAGRVSWAMAGQAALKGVVLIVLTSLFFYPLQAHYELPATGFIRMADRETTPFHQYLAQFGVFLFLAAGFVFFQARRASRRMGGWRFFTSLVSAFVVIFLAATVFVGAVGPVLKKVPGPFEITGLSSGAFMRDIAAGVLAPLPGPNPVAASVDQVGTHDSTPLVGFALGCFALLAVIAWFSMRRMRSTGAIHMFVFGMLALSLLLSASVDVAVLNFDIQRMNTVFKFYLHAWILLAVVAAFSTWYVLDVARPQLSIRLPRQLSMRWPSSLAAPAFVGGAAVLVLCALVYPVIATPERVQDRFDNAGSIRPRTDDGLAFMQGAQFGAERGTMNLADDYAGIQWMRENVKGSPTIIEGVTPLYQWGNRFAVNTGLPAVVGWDWHQTQQRGTQHGGAMGRLITSRQADVKLFYSTTDPLEAQGILEKYRVRYVVLGELEQIYFPGAGLSNIQAGLGGMVHLVFQSGATQIFQVTQPSDAYVTSSS